MLICLMGKIFTRNIFLLFLKAQTIFLFIRICYWKSLSSWKPARSISFKDSFRILQGGYLHALFSLSSGFIDVICFNASKLLYTFSFDYFAYRRMWDVQLSCNIPWIDMSPQVIFLWTNQILYRFLAFISCCRFWASRTFLSAYCIFP